VDRDLLAGAIRHLELRRVLALEDRPKELQEVDEFPVLELRKGGQPVGALDLDQLDAAVCRLPQIIQQIRVSLEERA
jgi:hypothetical protein